eukprot:1630728-Prymnesium_polylepis.2
MVFAEAWRMGAGLRSRTVWTVRCRDAWRRGGVGARVASALSLRRIAVVVVFWGRCPPLVRPCCLHTPKAPNCPRQCTVEFA